jgi:hypothetical protein
LDYHQTTNNTTIPERHGIFSSSSSSSLVTENHQRTDVYFPAVAIITEQNKNKT